MATHFSILAWRIPWTEAWVTVHGVANSQTQLKWLSMHTLMLSGAQSNFIKSKCFCIIEVYRNIHLSFIDWIVSPCRFICWSPNCSTTECDCIWRGISLVAQLVENLPALRETWVRSLSWEDPLEKGMATYSSILAWRIPWTILSMELQRVGHDWVTFTSL